MGKETLCLTHPLCFCLDAKGAASRHHLAHVHTRAHAHTHVFVCVVPGVGQSKISIQEILEKKMHSEYTYESKYMPPNSFT